MGVDEMGSRRSGTTQCKLILVLTPVLHDHQSVLFAILFL